MRRRVRTAAARSRTSLAAAPFFFARVPAPGLAGRLAAASAGLTPSLEINKEFVISEIQILQQ